MRAGFQTIPNILIQAQRDLKLDPLDVLIILHINQHWWKASELPYPKPGLIAERIGVSRRTIERRLSALEKAQLIKRLPSEERRGVSVRKIQLTGLIERLSKLAEGAVAARTRPPGLEASNNEDRVFE